MTLAPTLFLALALTAADGDRELPVQSITAFKDGHALVIREGTHEVIDGSILLDGLPNPLLGTFWPYATDEGNDVVSATASQIPTKSQTVVSSAIALLRANTGKSVSLNVVISDSEYRIGGRIEAVTGGNDNESSVLLRDGAELVSVLTRTIQGVSFPEGAEYKIDVEGTTPGLRLKLKNGNVDSAGVGLMYVEKGFRWIPQYRMTLGDDGKASYVLRATLVNDVIDIEDATVNLVVGVPTFAFAGQTDPIALGTNVNQVLTNTRLGRQFRNSGLQSQIMSNSAYSYGDSIAVEEAAPEVTGAKRSEDLFVFTVEHVTLKKGERMSIEVSRGEVEYEHYFQVDLPVLPPAEIGNIDQRQKDIVAKLLQNPQVQHQLKVRNKSREPLTTAPTLLFTSNEDGHETLLAQSLQTYTPPGGDGRIDLGTAIEINVKFDEEETGRQTAARKRGSYMYDQINLNGTITVCNHRPEISTLVVRRYVPGPLASVSDDGSMKILAPFDADATTAGLSGGNISGNWWYRYRPSWYLPLNPISRAEWTLELAPEVIQEPTYEWHYFWRW